MSTIGHFTVGRDMHAKCTTKSFSAPDGILWTMTYICSAIGNKLCFLSFLCWFCYVIRNNVYCCANANSLIALNCYVDSVKIFRFNACRERERRDNWTIAVGLIKK